MQTEAQEFEEILAGKCDVSFIRHLYQFQDLKSADSALLSDPNYLAFSSEISLINEVLIRKISDLGVFWSIIDIGPGDPTSFSHKIAPIIDHNSIPNYIGIDCNQSVVKSIAAFIDKNLPSLRHESVIVNFFDKPDSIPKVKNAIYVLFGGTINGLPTYKESYYPLLELRNFIDTLRRQVPDSSYLVITTETNYSATDLLRTYSGDLTRKFLELGLQGIVKASRQLQLVSRRLKPKIILDDKARCVLFGYKAFADATLNDSKDTEISISQDQFFPVGISYRFDVKEYLTVDNPIGGTVNVIAGHDTAAVIYSGLDAT